MSQLKVTNVDRIIMPEDGSLWWQVKYEVIDPDPGEPPTRYHLFPNITFEWRAAEYGLEDPEEILDVILSEPFVAQDSTPSLFETNDTEEARGAHRTRCSRAKLAKRVSSRGITNPLEMIRSSVVINEDSVRSKREEFTQARNAWQDQQSKRVPKNSFPPGNVNGGKEKIKGMNRG